MREAEKIAGLESFYTPGNMEWPHLIDNALKAHFLYRCDRDYVVMNGEIIIVDEFTGRLMTGRQWSDGLHQAVEAKERVRIKEENQTLATITLQNYFKLYKKLAGMTGTAMTEANEFWKVYKLDVVAIPTNRPLTRYGFPDVIYRTDHEKYNSIIDEIKEVHETGRPILVGTTSIEKSELISDMLSKFGISHQVLNAKYHESEAEIVAQAGRKNMVTIATNMAGRGTDIILGGNPEFMAWADLKREVDEYGRPKYPTRLEVPPEAWRAAVDRYEPEMRVEGREVAEVGGLHIIGTERHESRRIDNQLRGRAGRQGDPGSSRFFLSLEDDLMRKFAGEWVSAVLARLGMEEGEAIESKMVSRRIEGAQKKVEERNFDARKNLLEYDEVMDEQRKRVYSFRQRLLDGDPAKDAILQMIDTQVGDAVNQFLADDYGPSSFAEWAGQRLGVDLVAKMFRGAKFEDAQELARHEALERVTDQIREAIEENLPFDAEPSEWNWLALASWANTRYGMNLKDKDLRKFATFRKDEVELDREALSSSIDEQASAAIQLVDLAPAAEFLAEDWGHKSLAGWIHHKFALVLDPAAWTNAPRDQVGKQLKSAARALYARKEGEFPVRVAMNRYMADRRGNQAPRYDRDGLAAWFEARFGVAVNPDQLQPMLRPEIEALLLDLAAKNYAGAKLAEELGGEGRGSPTALKPRGREGRPHARSRGRWPSSAHWAARENLGVETTGDELASSSRTDVRRKLFEALDSKHRPEMREMEKVLVLQFLDSSWMEHLRGMDHLRSSVGLRGYAQVDPKVEYKREGMKLFEEMWKGISDKVTDLIFRMEQIDPEFLHYIGARWQLDRATTIHEAIRAAAGAARPSRPRLGAGSGRRRMRPSRPARRAASGRPSRSATRARRSAGTTPAPAGLVKSSRLAACGRAAAAT